MVLGLIWGREAAAFLGPARSGLSQQLMITPGSSAVAAKTRSAAASSFPRPHSTEGARALVTQVFWAIALFTGACSVRNMAASRSALQHKLRSCAVACQAVELPTPVVLQPRVPVVEE